MDATLTGKDLPELTGRNPTTSISLWEYNDILFVQASNAKGTMHCPHYILKGCANNSIIYNIICSYIGEINAEFLVSLGFEPQSFPVPISRKFQMTLTLTGEIESEAQELDSLDLEDALADAIAESYEHIAESISESCLNDVTCHLKEFYVE